MRLNLLVLGSSAVCTSASTDLMDAYMLSKEAFNLLQDQSMSEYFRNYYYYFSDHCQLAKKNLK
jgi:hypothetical protein